MKKLFLILFMTIFLTGCTSKPIQNKHTNSPQINSTVNNTNENIEIDKELAINQENIQSDKKEEITSTDENISKQEESQKTKDQVSGTQLNTNKKEEVSKKEEFKYSVKDLNKIMYATTSLNVRSGPTASYSKLGTYSYNEEVIVTGEVNENSWYRVSFKGKEGYVSSKYLTSEKAKPFSTILIKDGSVSDSLMKSYDSQWKKIPSKMRDFILNKGWKIYITSKSIQGNYYKGPVSGSIAGVTLFTDCKIYVDSRNTTMNRNVLLHEFGHALDFELHWKSDSEEFKNIYKEEKNKFKDVYNVGDKHNTSSELEYFAEAFKLYIIKPSAVKSSAPKTYNYMQNLFNNF